MSPLPEPRIKNTKGSAGQGWHYGTVRSEFAYYVPRTLNHTVPAYRTSVQFLKRTVPVPQCRHYRGGTGRAVAPTWVYSE